jgi:PAS domain S-box-containing protein
MTSVDQQSLREHLIATGPTVMFRRTTEGVVTYLSPNTERILGYSLEEVVGVPGFWAAHVHPDDRDLFVAEEREALERGATGLERDYRFLHKDDTYRWLHARTHIEYDETGAAEALLGHAIDMTERRSAEEQNEQLFGFPLALIFVAGLDGYFRRVSAGYQRLLGWTEQELLSRPFFEFVHPDDLGVLGASIQQVAAGSTEVIDQEIRALCKDGSYRWLMGNYRPVPEEGLMYGMAIDITQRKHAEEALRESERRTRLILDTAYEAFISIDLEGRILDWNAEAERVFGWSREEALGRLAADTIVPERHRAAHVRGLEHYRATGEGPLLGRLIEIEALRKDGSEFPVELTISPMRVDSTVVFNAFLRDVTERKRAEEALQAARGEAEGAREQAELANRAKSEFLARMSHELRTPLNAILGFAQLLEIDDLGAEQSESVQQILRAGRHLLQLIDEVLDVARIEQGSLSLSIEPVHVREVVREALDLVQPLAASANIRIRAEVSQFDGHALADRQRLKQVLMNMLSNAIKYNREGGDVTVSCGAAPGGLVRIEVADTGPGIPAEMMDRLFLPFERLGAERTSVEGTGIGLSISKRLVELMGGEIGAESQIGRGSTFWVELEPAESPEERAEPAAESTPEVPVGSDGERTVLYVEDNLSNLRLVERILARRPTARLITAMQGGLALDLAREHRPDLILLDVHLPDIDGGEVLRRLREDPATRDIPVVAVSAEATPRKIERFLAAGARAYLTKPLDVKQFLEVVDEALADRMP